MRSRHANRAPELLRNARLVIQQLERVQPEVQAYLMTSEARPPIANELVRLFMATDQLVELVSPSDSPEEGFRAAFGLPDEVIGGKSGSKAEFSNREGLDFFPWMHQKVTRVRSGLRHLVELWLLDPREVSLRLDAPMSPREWVRDGLLSALSEMEHNVSKIHDIIEENELVVAEIAGERRGSSVPLGRPTEIPLLRELGGEAEVVKIGLRGAAWTDDPAAWAAGAFPETRERIAAALAGESPSLRVLNVQVYDGADVIVEKSRFEAILWKKWNPVYWDAGDRGIRPPESAELEECMLRWASSQMDLRVTATDGSPVIAAVITTQGKAHDFEQLSGALLSANEALIVSNTKLRAAYIDELERAVAELG